jgi:peptidoglycan/xylan/chitin deacetylase (PgdA/CDA1 family)
MFLKFKKQLFLMFISSLVLAEVEQFPLDGYNYSPLRDRGFAQYLTKSIYGSNKIALTFDDGPDAVKTPRLLDILKQYNVQATFFILTEKINSTTLPIVERMINEGHLVASHHHMHTNSNQANLETYKMNLKKSIDKIEQIEADMGVFQNEMYYRFPYGAYGQNTHYHHLNVMKEISQQIYGDNCINFAFWDIDTVDWLAGMTASDVKDNILAQLFGGTAYRHKEVMNQGVRSFTKEAYQVTKPVGGGVVLMHDIHQRSVDATELFLQQAQQLNIEIVPLSAIDEFSYGNKLCRTL